MTITYVDLQTNTEENLTVKFCINYPNKERAKHSERARVTSSQVKIADSCFVRLRFHPFWQILLNQRLREGLRVFHELSPDHNALWLRLLCWFWWRGVLAIDRPVYRTIYFDRNMIFFVRIRFDKRTKKDTRRVDNLESKTVHDIFMTSWLTAGTDIPDTAIYTEWQNRICPNVVRRTRYPKAEVFL